MPKGTKFVCAGGAGIEPALMEPESIGLPLAD
ncbi:unnamed protein product, partial [marine sediment metagenome]